MAASMRFDGLVRLGNLLIKKRSLVPGQIKQILRLHDQITSTGRGQVRVLGTQQAAASDSDGRYHNIIRDSEKATGESAKHEFQAETRMLLDIVAKSLYSDKEVFIRELISNASDALEKLRYLRLEGGQSQDPGATGGALEIHIATDKQHRTLTIQDTGIGMSKEELIANLGTIARSGSKAFLEQLKGEAGGEDMSTIIGQFGVGFYSSFMVADKVEVFTRGSQPGSVGLRWTSEGTGTYEIQEAEGVQPGTKIVLHLKPDCREFSDEEVIRGIIKKYSNFVGSAIFLNGERANVIQPLWLMDPKEVTPQMHEEFYRFVGNTFDSPRFTLHYRTDAPLTLRALLYFPEGKPGLFEMSRDTDIGVALYSRKVLIKSKADNILPKWLRFVKGVVDSEDIPLNLSRELLQNSALIRKLRTVLTNRILRFLHDKSTKEPEAYEQFYKDYGLFLKEGIVIATEQLEKEEIVKLLRFESSNLPPGGKVTLPEYLSRRKEGQKDIFYLAAPSRELAEASPYFEALKRRDVEVLFCYEPCDERACCSSRELAEASPYFEALKRRDVEVLFCYEPYDELVLMQLRQFDGVPLTSVEKEMRKDKEPDDLSDLGEGSLRRSDAEALMGHVKKCLAGKVHSVRVTKRLDSHPCVVTVEEMAAARHFVRTQSHQLTEESRYALLQPQLEINPRHPIIKKLSKLTTDNPKLAELVIQQLFCNAMVSAGLMEDPRTLVSSMNELLALALDKH